jgi:hypothetical protein
VNYNDQSEQQVASRFNVPVAFVIGETRATNTNIAPNATRSAVPTLATGRFGSDLPSARKKPKSLLEKLGKVSDSFDDFKESRDRRAIYGYLVAVFDLVMEYRSERRTKRLARRAYKYLGFNYSGDAEVFAAAIRGTSGGEVDDKTISKWARALRYVVEFKKARTPLKVFMLSKGGVNACANLYAEHLGRSSR